MRRMALVLRLEIHALKRKFSISIDPIRTYVVLLVDMASGHQAQRQLVVASLEFLR